MKLALALIKTAIRITWTLFRVATWLADYSALPVLAVIIAGLIWPWRQIFRWINKLT